MSEAACGAGSGLWYGPRGYEEGDLAVFRRAAPSMAIVRVALAEYERAAAAIEAVQDRGTVGECQQLRDLLVEHRLPGRTVVVPGEDGAALQPLALVEWMNARRRAYLVRSEKHAVAEAVVAWFSERSWLVDAARGLATHRRFSRACDGLRVLLYQVEQHALAEREAEAREKAAAAKRAAAERKAKVRRTMAEAARSRSEFLGYAVLDSEAFNDERPRWSYVLLGQDGQLYAGSALSLRGRVRAHRRGSGASVTRDTRQPWHLLHAERLPIGQAALCTEFALLHSVALRHALLAHCETRARRLFARHGCAVPWLGLNHRQMEVA